MTVILCAGSRGEILFHNRRVSQDGVVKAELCAVAEERGLYVTPYSARLLAASSGVHISSDPLTEAETDGICFLEDTFPTIFQHIPKLDELVIYRWDKTYPLDGTFPVSRFLEAAKQAGAPFSLMKTIEFAGRTHELITKEVYRKCASEPCGESLF